MSEMGTARAGNDGGGHVAQEQENHQDDEDNRQGKRELHVMYSLTDRYGRSFRTFKLAARGS